MSDTKMLQAILDGQRGIKEELLEKVDKLEKKVDSGFKGLNSDVLENRKRINKLGLDIAELSDDSPAMEEFEDHEKRVDKIEKQVASV